MGNSNKDETFYQLLQASLRAYRKEVLLFEKYHDRLIAYMKRLEEMGRDDEVASPGVAHRQARRMKPR